MNASFKEEIESLIRNDDLVLDLTHLNEEEITHELADFILDLSKTVSNLGRIKWNKNSLKSLDADLKAKIERITEQLIKNNLSFTRFPSDYIHCLMSYHVYTSQTEQKNTHKNEEDLNKTNESEEASSVSESIWSKLAQQDWSVEEIFAVNEYKSILYTNRRTKQMVLSFQGIRLHMADFFSVAENSVPEKMSQSFASFLVQEKQLPHHTIYSYLHAKRAVELSYQNGYSLSFTGYAFGAWLAEQSILFCHKDFNHRNTRAVTFESPGSSSFLEKLRQTCLIDDIKFELEDLDLRSYLTEPNFVNTCNKHLGQVFCVTTDNCDLNPDMSIIETIENESVRNQIVNYFNQQKEITSHMKTYCLLGLISIASIANLNIFLKVFAKEKESVKSQFKKVINWPKIETKVSFVNQKLKDDCHNNLLPTDLIDHCFKHIPLIDSVPDSIKSLTAVGMQLEQSSELLQLKLNVKVVSDYLYSLSILFNLIVETFVDFELFEKNNDAIDNSRTRKSKKKGLELSLDFQEYVLKEINYEQDSLTIAYGNIDYFLEKLAKINEFTDLKDEFIMKQIKQLRVDFKLELTDQNKMLCIKTTSNTNCVEAIRERLSRLISIDQEIINFLEDYFLEPLERKPIDEANKSAFQSFFKESKLKHFIGREKEIKFMRETFLTKQYICVYGKAGSGKSTLARQFAYEKCEKDKHLTVRWIDASCRQDILVDFKRIALEIDIMPCKESCLINTVKCRLNSYPRKERYLFILDNVNNEKDIEDLVSGFNKNIDFLLTTRNEFIQINDEQNFEKLTLKNFIREEALTFIHKCVRIKLTNQWNDTDWKDIVESLESSKTMTISPYKLNRLISVLNEHMHWSPADIKEYISREKEEKFYLVKTECPEAYTLLSYLTYLDEKSINLELIRTILIDSHPDEVASAINYLMRNGELVQTDSNCFRVHELSQFHMAAAINKNLTFNKNEIVNAIVLAINNLFVAKYIEDSKMNMSKKTEILFKQSSRVLRLDWASKFKNENCGDLFKKMARFTKEILFDYRSSLHHYQDELKVRKHFYPGNNSKIAFILNHIAVAYYCQEEYKKSLEFYIESYKIYKDISNCTYNSCSDYNPINLANCLHNIAVVYRQLEQHTKALEAYEESLRIKKENLPPSHTSIAMTLNNIGLVYENMGFLEKALGHYLECLKIFREILAPNHSSLSSVLTSVANVYRKMGNYEKALEYQLESLEIKKQEEPVNSSTLAMTYNNVGLIYCYLENYEKSLENYNESLRLFIDTLPANYSSIASTINNIANVYSDAGEYRKALENYKESLRIKKETLPANHSSIATTLNNIGLIYDNLGDHEKALENYKECLLIFKETMPSSHTSVVSTLTSIGNAHYKLGNYKKALDYFKETLFIKKQTLPAEHISIGTCLNSIGFVYEKLKDHEKALESFNLSLKIYEKMLPIDHPTLVAARKNIELSKRKQNLNLTSISRLA